MENNASAKASFNISKFLWWCAGADSLLLFQLSSAERQKYSGIGITVLSTAILSFISAAYIFYTVFENALIAEVFGIMWAVLIFTLERYAVTYVTNTSSIVQTLLKSVPSIIIALIIAPVISYPITIKIFENQIMQQQVKLKEELKQAATASFKSISQNTQAYELEIQSQLKDTKQKYEQMLNEYMVEINGGKAGLKGGGYVANLKKEKIEELKKDIKSLEDKRRSLHEQATNLRIVTDKEQAMIDSAFSKQTFFDKFKAISYMAERDPTVNTVKTFITLMFFLITIAPILMKVLSKDIYQIVTIRSGPIVEQGVGTQEDREEDKDHNSDSATGTIDEPENTSKRIAPNPYVFYFTSTIQTMNDKIEKYEIKAKEIYWQGMIFSCFGILTAFCLIAFWLNYFSIKKFETYHIYVIASGTIVIVMIEFLGAWFLKHHKVVSDTALHVFKLKTSLDRHYLLYLATKELSDGCIDKDYTNHLLSALSKEFSFPNDGQSSSSSSTGFAEEAFSSIANLTEAIKHISKKKT